MDKTKTYIQMSEQAKHILPPHEAEDGDLYAYRITVEGAKDEFTDIRIVHYSDMSKPSGSHIPIYRQDQLQKMVLNDCYTAIFGWHSLAYDMWFAFAVWVKTQFKDKTNTPSGEQLWLTFVMWELYQERWTGTEWKKETNPDTSV